MALPCRVAEHSSVSVLGTISESAGRAIFKNHGVVSGFVHQSLASCCHLASFRAARRSKFAPPTRHRKRVGTFLALHFPRAKGSAGCRNSLSLDLAQPCAWGQASVYSQESKAPLVGSVPDGSLSRAAASDRVHIALLGSFSPSPPPGCKTRRVTIRCRKTKLRVRIEAGDRSTDRIPHSERFHPILLSEPR